MKNLIRTCSPALLAIALGMPAFAQDQDKTGINVQFRARFGYGLEAKDNLPHRAIGLGLELGYTTPFGRFAGEVGFQYKPGDQYQYDWESLLESQVPDGTYINYALDRRRTHLQGTTFRLSYEYELQNNCMIRGGVQLFGTVFRQEFIGVAEYIAPDKQIATANLIRDTYAGPVRQSTSASPSPFVGVGYRFGSSSIELNVIGLSYTAIDYVHVANVNNPVGYGDRNDKDYCVETKRTIPHIEIAYAFRF